MARLTDPYAFTAEGLRLQWPQIAVAMLRRSQHLDGPWLDDLHRIVEELVHRRPVDLALRWMCSHELGVPPGPFSVWIRDGGDKTVDVGASVSSRPAGLVLGLDRVAAIIDVDFQVNDETRPAALWAFRDAVRPQAAIAVTAGTPAGPGRMRLRLRTTGTTRVLLVNGSDPQVTVVSLQDVVDADDWQRIELVGLPDSGGLGAYDPTPQGPADALVDPVAAAVGRLQRGGPPVGWWPVTEAGRLAPPWEPPDAPRLVDEVRETLLPEIAALYDAGVSPPDQRAIAPVREIAGPPVPPGRAPRRTTAKVPPLSLLTLGASSDPFLALATGFGTAYAMEPVDEGQKSVGGADFLVTAYYPDTHRREGPAELAAFVPSPEGHSATAPVTTLQSARAGLVAPDPVDTPWRESVKLTWDRREATALAGRPAGLAVARYDLAAGAQVESLNPERDSGGYRPLVPMPQAPTGQPGHDRDVFVDGGAEIPMGSGGRSAGYAVAVEDVFGIWSPWEDTAYTGDEPAPPLPRVIALRLDSSYEGSPICPGRLVVDVATDWAERGPATLELGWVLFAAAAETDADPAGTAPATVRRYDFVGATLVDPTSQATIDHLDPGGASPVAPGLPQGEHTRRYRLTVPVPTLDFTSARRWRVHLWVRSTVRVAPGLPGPWSPRLGPPREAPARAEAASPVPATPLPIPLPPGVPVGSTPDGGGCSHVRVRWQLPPGGDVDRLVVWEASESAVRQTVAALTSAPAVPPPAQAPEGTPPHARLTQLRSMYDALPPTRRTALWRRLMEFDRHPSTIPADADVALPKGSTDLHLFAVTAETSTGVASSLPASSDGVQFFTAPRLRQPSQPRVTPTVAADGDVTLAVSATSRIAVASFAVLATRSPVAARTAETMGPPVATLAVVAAPTEVPAGRRLFPDERLYRVTGVVTLPASWDEWYLRVVAVPVAGDPPMAVRGLRSPESEALSLLMPPSGPPLLDALVADTWGAGSDGVVVRASSDAPTRAPAFGAHRFSALVTGSASLAIDPVAVPELVVPADPSAPPVGADTGAVALRGERSGGRTPLVLWFRRAVAADPCTVTLRVVDPMGRLTSRDLVVPGVSPPGVTPTLEVLDLFALAGRGLVARLRSDAPVGADAPGPALLAVDAVTSALPWWRLPRPPFGRPEWLRRGDDGPLGRRPPTVRVTFPLPDVPLVPERMPFVRSPAIALVRTTDASPYEYSLLVALRPPVEVALTMELADGSRATTTFSS